MNSIIGPMNNAWTVFFFPAQKIYVILLFMRWKKIKIKIKIKKKKPENANAGLDPHLLMFFFTHSYCIIAH